jgi:hypothetical protein
MFTKKILIVLKLLKNRLINFPIRKKERKIENLIVPFKKL